jgi:low temperature requirement protein LtrA
VNTDRRAESGPTPSRAAGSSPEHAEAHAGSGDDTTPLIQPPRLRTDEERTATRLELFFDLAYVLVVAELALTFSKDLSMHGALVFAGLVTITWWSWVTTTLYANRFDTNDIIYRLAKLGSTAAVMAMAASAQEATGATSTIFALSYIATRVMLVLLYARAYRHVREARATIGIYLAGASAAATLWAVSLAVHGNARYLLWAVGILVEAAAPILATRYGGGVPLHLDHLPERFGLLVILVLGESIASIVIGVHDTHWTTPSVLIASLAFLTVAALWWIYFDLGGAAGKKQLVDDGDDQESGIADAYVYGHLPLIIGLAVVAVGVEQFITHSGTGLTDAGRWALHGGVAVFLAGIAVVMAGTSGRWRAAWPWPTVAIPVVVIPGLISALPASAALGIVTAVLTATVLAGILQQRRGALQTTET